MSADGTAIAQFFYLKSHIRAIDDFSRRMLVVGAMLAISGLARPVSKTWLQQQYLAAEQDDLHSSLQT